MDMNTPLDDFIPRNGQSEEVHQEINRLSQNLDTLVNAGGHIFSWLLQRNGGDIDLQPAMFLRHIIEHIDAVSIQITGCSVDPCKGLLRILVESALSLEYMIDQDFERRSRAYIVTGALNENKILEKMLGESQAGKHYKTNLEKDDLIGHRIELPSPEKIKQQIEVNNKVLALPANQEAVTEYKRLEIKTDKNGKTKITNPAWYSLFDGPGNIEQMAQRLNRTSFYEILYRYWSGTVHATDLIKGKISVGNDGKAYISSIRDIRGIQETVVHTSNIAVLIYGIVVRKLLPEKEEKYLQWYLSIRASFMELIEREIFKFD